MTVHIHNSLQGVHIGEHHHRRTKTKKTRRPELDTDRTWALECDPACERRILADVEFASSHPGGVPLTTDEKALAEDLESEAQIEAARMGKALAGMVKERIQSGEPIPDPAGRAKAKAKA